MVLPTCRISNDYDFTEVFSQSPCNIKHQSFWIILPAWPTYIDNKPTKPAFNFHLLIVHVLYLITLKIYNFEVFDLTWLGFEPMPNKTRNQCSVNDSRLSVKTTNKHIHVLWKPGTFDQRKCIQCFVKRLNVARVYVRMYLINRQSMKWKFNPILCTCMHFITLE